MVMCLCCDDTSTTKAHTSPWSDKHHGNLVWKIRKLALFFAEQNHLLFWSLFAISSLEIRRFLFAEQIQWHLAIRISCNGAIAIRAIQENESNRTPIRSDQLIKFYLFVNVFDVKRARNTHTHTHPARPTDPHRCKCFDNRMCRI